MYVYSGTNSQAASQKGILVHRLVVCMCSKLLTERAIYADNAKQQHVNNTKHRRKITTTTTGGGEVFLNASQPSTEADGEAPRTSKANVTTAKAHTHQLFRRRRRTQQFCCINTNKEMLRLRAGQGVTTLFASTRRSDLIQYYAR